MTRSVHKQPTLLVKGQKMIASYISYYRVSTTRQGVSGLGLQAQQNAASEFTKSSGGQIIKEFTEVESGKRIARPELDAAIEACRLTGSTLLIAKLDRLARNVHFISGLIESKTRFVAVDMPNADRFMLHVYAAMAEEEGRRISERTKLSLAAAKARGTKLGEHAKVLNRRNASIADEFARSIGPLIVTMHQKDGVSFKDVSEILNAEGVKSYRGSKWHSTSVYRTYKRFTRLPPVVD